MPGGPLDPLRPVRGAAPTHHLAGCAVHSPEHRRTPRGASALQDPHRPPGEARPHPQGRLCPPGTPGTCALPRRQVTRRPGPEAAAAAALTGHREVLSVDDVILDIEQALVAVVVQVLQVGHHSHAAPAVLALRARRDGHRLLGRRVLLPEPAVGVRASGQPGGSPSSLCRSCPRDRAPVNLRAHP